MKEKCIAVAEICKRLTHGVSGNVKMICFVQINYDLQ